jgi:hypothetical protein
MQQVIQYFRRESDGQWACVAPATIDLPTGRIQVTPGMKFKRGTTFMNVELAKMLDEYYDRHLRRF